jgi:hypothetical protein
MSDRPSQPAGPTRQPFRLLDLPRELLVVIVRSYRSPIEGRSDGLVIYEGEMGKERYRVLRDLCLTHRDILPFAQEELFKRITLRSNERMDRLNRSIASSERCKEYASRAESIVLGGSVNVDKLMKSGALDARELLSYVPLRISALSNSRFDRCDPPSLTLILSKDRFQNLRRLHVSPKFDTALALPNLEMYSSIEWDSISIDAKIAFTSVNLPNLRRLTITFDNTRARGFAQLFELIIPQLDHLTLRGLHETDIEHLLLPSPSLQLLHCSCDSSSEGTTRMIKQIIRIDLKELHFTWSIQRESSDNWETDFDLIEKFKKVMGGKDELERVKLVLSFEYDTSPSRDACNRALVRWKGIKKELELICARKGIEVVALTCSFYDEETAIA